MVGRELHGGKAHTTHTHTHTQQAASMDTLFMGTEKYILQGVRGKKFGGEQPRNRVKDKFLFDLGKILVKYLLSFLFFTGEIPASSQCGILFRSSEKIFQIASHPLTPSPPPKKCFLSYPLSPFFFDVWGNKQPKNQLYEVCIDNFFVLHFKKYCSTK